MYSPYYTRIQSGKLIGFRELVSSREFIETDPSRSRIAELFQEMSAFARTLYFAQDGNNESTVQPLRTLEDRRQQYRYQPMGADGRLRERSKRGIHADE